MGYGINKTLTFPWYIPLLTVPLIFILYRSYFTYQKSKYLLTLIAIIIVPNFLSYLFYKDFQFERVQQYRLIGSEINSSDPKSTILSPEIGALGFEFKGEIIDALGLVSSKALPFHPMPVPEERDSGAIGAIPWKLVEEIKPTYIVALDIFAKSLLASNTAKQYNDISHEFNLSPIPLWKSKGILILKRID